MSPSPRKHRRTALGFSLVEVLVSIVVLSFGLLGMVGLQATSLQANREARLQSIASEFARELGELMRGNADIAALTASNPYIFDLSSPLAAPTASYCLAVGSSCANTTAIANAEITEWLARVDEQLPGARVKVCVDSAPFDAAGLPTWGCTAAQGIATIKIGWTRGSFNRASGALDRATVPGVVVPVDIKAGT